MLTDVDLLQQALEALMRVRPSVDYCKALESCAYGKNYSGYKLADKTKALDLLDDAIAALSQRLRQPDQQEPACAEAGERQHRTLSAELTDAEILEAVPGGIIDCLLDPWDNGVGDGDTSRSVTSDIIRIGQAVQQKLKEKMYGSNF